MFELAQTFLADNWITIAKCVGSAAGGLVAAYGVVIRDVAYIKGVLSNLNDNDARIERVEVQVISIKTSLADAGIHVESQRPPAEPLIDLRA